MTYILTTFPSSAFAIKANSLSWMDHINYSSFKEELEGFSVIFFKKNQSLKQGMDVCKK